MVSRISKGAVRKLLSGETNQPFAAVIKIYGNSCHYCHSLKESYSSLSEEFDDVLFYAFNIADYPEIENILDFEGIPTIVFIQNNGNVSKIRVIPEPSKPDKRTWYTSDGIRDFINKERM